MNQKKSKPQATKRVTLRLSPIIYDRIQQSATYNGNTVNAEIIARLEALPSVTDRFDQLAQDIAEVKAIAAELLKSK